MKYDAFVDRVAERAGLSDRTAAERSAVAVLPHLCDRLTGDEAPALLAQISVGDVPHDRVLRSIELLATEVAPVVREEIARRTATASQAAG